MPSAVSAIKVDGRRSYARVRAGETVDLPARPVTVHEIGLGALRVDGPFLDVDLSVRCSSGTYIRALARDLGAALAVGGHLTALRRTAVGPVGLAEATPLAELQEGGQQGAPLAMLDLEATVARFFPVLSVDADAARDVGFGRALDLVLPAPGPVALLAPDGRFLALYRHETQDHDGAERRRAPSPCSSERVWQAFPAQVGTSEEGPCGCGAHCPRFPQTSGRRWSPSATSTASTSVTSTWWRGPARSPTS